MDDKLKKIIDLARRTGDKVFIYDSAGFDETVVLMGVDEYEKILQNNNNVKDLTETELLDRINCDIALWRSENSTNDEMDDSGEISDVDSQKQEKKVSKNSAWKIPAEVKAAIDDAEFIDNNDDDHQYLEDIKEVNF